MSVELYIGSSMQEWVWNNPLTPIIDLQEFGNKSSLDLSDFRLVSKIAMKDISLQKMIPSLVPIICSSNIHIVLLASKDNIPHSILRWCSKINKRIVKNSAIPMSTKDCLYRVSKENPYQFMLEHSPKSVLYYEAVKNKSKKWIDLMVEEI